MYNCFSCGTIIEPTTEKAVDAIVINPTVFKNLGNGFQKGKTATLVACTSCAEDKITDAIKSKDIVRVDFGNENEEDVLVAYVQKCYSLYKVDSKKKNT